jgi:regulator of CtrA degradation
MTEIFAVAAADHRILDFARSEVFDRTFREGMVLVEETAAYLDGPGRAASKSLDRLAALAYAGESMRLTTRLMQVASWLLVQRAVRDGEMQISQARDAKFRLSGREAIAGAPNKMVEVPEGLTILIARAGQLYERVRRLDDSMYTGPVETTASVDSVGGQMARLQAAFAGRRFGAE